jgi:hypothetical protein
VPVLAHEFQHLINASRKIYINTAAPDFEVKWLDEGLAHIAEELLFYRESGTGPRTNLDLAALRANATIRGAFNNDMLGNAGRYRTFLVNPSTASPYMTPDSLSMRGASWDWLRYLADQKMSGVTRSPTAAIELAGTGTVSVPGSTGTVAAEYYATLVNSSTTSDGTTLYGLTASNVIAPGPSLIPLGVATLSLSPSAAPSLTPSGLGSGALASSAPVLQRDERFEARLRAQERAIAPALLPGARQWYRSASHVELPQGGRYSLSVAPITSPDGDIWFRLVNNTVLGIQNVQGVFGVDLSLAVSDWSASHAVDDVSAMVPDQFLQKSWNWHSIYPAINSGTYPLVVRTMVAGTPYSGSILSGGSTHFRFAVPPGGTATLTVTSSSPAPSSLRLEIVRTK